jgi:hypothetical protein
MIIVCKFLDSQKFASSTPNKSQPSLVPFEGSQKDSAPVWIPFIDNLLRVHTSLPKPVLMCWCLRCWCADVLICRCVDTGCCKSPIRFEKRVYLSKSALNLLKTWFSRDKSAKMSSKPGFCLTWFMKVRTKICKTWDKLNGNLPKTPVLLSFVSSHVDKPDLWNLPKVNRFLSIHQVYIFVQTFIIQV